MRRSHRIFLTACAAVFVSVGCTRGPQSTLDPAGPSAEAIAQTWWLMAGLFGSVWLLVMVFVCWALFRGRNTRALSQPVRLIVVGGLVLPTTVLVGLLAWGTWISARVTGVGVQPEHVIDVFARQWEWDFRYLDADGAVRARSGTTLHLPRGEMVEFRIHSEDVVHSFWIPRLGGKIDAVPGRVNVLRLRVDDDGGRPMRGQCAEFCGLEHTHMIFAVDVMPPDAWLAWRDGGGDADATDTGRGDGSGAGARAGNAADALRARTRARHAVGMGSDAAREPDVVPSATDVETGP